MIDTLGRDEIKNICLNVLDKEYNEGASGNNE